MNGTLPAACPQSVPLPDLVLALTPPLPAGPPAPPARLMTVTELLRELRAGRSDALERLFSLVYDELQRIARRHLARESGAEALESADLVHEAFLRLVDPARVEWQDQHHFYALASRAMRQILIDLARRRRAARRGGGWRRVELDDPPAVEERTELRLEVAQALARLARRNERLGRVVECRFFGVLSELEMARALGVSERTVRRDWRQAKAWLRRELAE